MSRWFIVAVAFLAALGAYQLYMREAEKVPLEPLYNGERWVRFQPASQKFSVLFPSTPKQAGDTLKDSTTQELRHYELYLAESRSGKIYMINAITLPHRPSDEQGVFESFVKDMLASNPHNQLASSVPTQFLGRAAWDFEIANSEGLLVSKMFIDGETIYVLSLMTKPGQYHEKDFSNFISTFELLQKKNGSSAI